MTTQASASGEREELLFGALEHFLHERAHRAFAVVDGSLVENLPRRLAREGLDHRSLVLGSADRNLAATGLWLINLFAASLRLEQDVPNDGGDAGELSDEALERRAETIAQSAKVAVEKGDETGGGAFSPLRSRPGDPIENLHAIRRLAGAGPGVVFWCGGSHLEPEVMFRHLRGIGRVVLEAPREEIVLFRHADANVLAQVLPALDGGNLARFMGLADFLLFAPDEPWGGGLKRVSRPAGPAVLSPGLLRLKGGSIRSMEEARAEHSRAKVASYLRKVAPADTSGMDDAQLLQRVRSYEATGSQIGLRSERAQAQWSYLMLTTSGAVAQDGEVRAALSTRRGGGPDGALDKMMRQMVRLSRRDASTGAAGREG